MALQPGECADGEGAGPYPKSGPRPECEAAAVGAVDVKEEGDQRETAPAVELQVDVHGHPSAVGPGVEKEIDARQQQHGGDEDADGVGDDQPEEAVPCGFGHDGAGAGSGRGGDL